MIKERKMKCKLGIDGCPHERELAFSDWIREKLPDTNTGFMSLDIDHVLFNFKTKKLLIIECKTHKIKFNSKVEFGQRFFLKMVKKVFMQLPKLIDGWIFDDIHLIQFDAYDFKTGKCYFDNVEISESDLIKKLSL